MKRFLVLAMTLTLALTLTSIPASADPPTESGAVLRLELVDSFGVFPDFDNGYWVFGNITRATFCPFLADVEAWEIAFEAWLEGGMIGPPPEFPPVPEAITPDELQVVFASDAEVIRLHAGGPTSLHAWVLPDDPGHPCIHSEEDASFEGDVQVTINDNDGPNMGTRTNSFGNRGRGTLTEVATGDRFHYNWNFRARWVGGNPEVNPEAELVIMTEKFNLKKKGKS